VCAAAASVLFAIAKLHAMSVRSLAREDNLLESLLIGIRSLLLRWIYSATK
jgi:hypothetical protein